MRVVTFRRWRGQGAKFEGIREIPVPATRGTTKDALRRSPFTCRKGAGQITLLDCMPCAHFVCWRPEPVHRQVMVRCLFTEDDPVSDIMTMPEAFVAVDPATSTARAETLAALKGIRHLLVARGDDVLGVTCQCDLRRADDPEAQVGHVVATPPWCVSPDTTLGEVAELFRSRRIGLALVVDGDRLAGLVTRGDLRRAGCPEMLLGARRHA